MNFSFRKSDKETFCYDCEYCRDCGGYDCGYGAPRYIPEMTCDHADFDPADNHCPRHEEWLDACDEDDAREEKELIARGWIPLEVTA